MPDGRITPPHRYKYLFLAPLHFSSSSLLPQTRSNRTTVSNIANPLQHLVNHHLLTITPTLTSFLSFIFTRSLQSRNQLHLATAQGFQWDSSCRFCNDMVHHAKDQDQVGTQAAASSRASAPRSLQSTSSNIPILTFSLCHLHPTEPPTHLPFDFLIPLSSQLINSSSCFPSAVIFPLSRQLIFTRLLQILLHVAFHRHEALSTTEIKTESKYLATSRASAPWSC